MRVPDILEKVGAKGGLKVIIAPVPVTRFLSADVGCRIQSLGDARHAVPGTGEHSGDACHGLPEDVVPVGEGLELEDAVGRPGYGDAS